MVDFAHVHTICFEKFENAMDFLSIARIKPQIPPFAFGQSICVDIVMQNRLRLHILNFFVTIQLNIFNRVVNSFC